VASHTHTHTHTHTHSCTPEKERHARTHARIKKDTHSCTHSRTHRDTHTHTHRERICDTLKPEGQEIDINKHRPEACKHWQNTHTHTHSLDEEQHLKDRVQHRNEHYLHLYLLDSRSSSHLYFTLTFLFSPFFSREIYIYNITVQFYWSWGCKTVAIWLGSGNLFLSLLQIIFKGLQKYSFQY